MTYPTPGHGFGCGCLDCMTVWNALSRATQLEILSTRGADPMQAAKAAIEGEKMHQEEMQERLYEDRARIANLERDMTMVELARQNDRNRYPTVECSRSHVRDRNPEIFLTVFGMLWALIVVSELIWVFH